MIILNLLLVTSLWAQSPDYKRGGDPNMAQASSESQGGLPCAPFMQCPPAGATEVGLGSNTNPTRGSNKDASDAIN